MCELCKGASGSVELSRGWTIEELGWLVREGRDLALEALAARVIPVTAIR